MSTAENIPYPRIGYLLRSYPRMSQTFVANEILALEAIGVPLEIFAITHPHEAIVQSQIAQIHAPVHYLEGSKWAGAKAGRQPRSYQRAWDYLQDHPEIDQGYTASPRFDCFQQAIDLAQLLQQRQQSATPITHLHAHFAHDPTLIAQLVHWLTGISFSFTAHARDIFQIPAGALADRIGAARAVVTGCQLFFDYLKQVSPPRQHHKLHIIHHGTNVEEFLPAPPRTPPVLPLILSASRLVEKKGYPDLLHAFAQLRQQGVDFRAVIYGEGPLEKTLLTLIDQLDLPSIVTLAGPCPQTELRQQIQQADLFALTPFVTEDNDIDGVPMVLVEAMACAIPVVSTRVGGIPDLIEHEQTGLLAEPQNVESIVTQLATLLNDHAKRHALGQRARSFVVEQFNLHSEAQQLAALFQAIMNDK